ncbi:GTP pyrophosphokinase family protein [Brevundimonas sp.]|uniref:GTP pyrophosphokinase family protein n=1 Tax=Brevundimonas sp. TaxID=1871086 RepID=UPI0037BE659B
MAISDQVIDGAVERYLRERDRYIKLAARVADICLAQIVEGDAIRAQVTYRTKTAQSFRGKLVRFSKRPDKDYPTVESVFEGITDFAGVRVATYRPEDEQKVADRLRELFAGPKDDVEIDIDLKNKLDADACQFYRATHCQVFLRSEDRVGQYDNLAGASCEVQICSMMAHVWNEIEHDIGYKPEGGGPTGTEKGLLQMLGHLTRSGDAAITRLLEANEQRMRSQTGEFTDVHDFVARLRSTFPGADLSVNAGQAYDAALRLKLNSLDTVRGAVEPFTEEAARARIEAFNAYVRETGQTHSLMNSASADLITALLLPLLKPFKDDPSDAISRTRSLRLSSLINAWKGFSAQAKAT